MLHKYIRIKFNQKLVECCIYICVCVCKDNFVSEMHNYSKDFRNLFLHIRRCQCRTIRRPGQSPEKINRGMILAPLAGIILNLFDASMITKENDIAGIFASMDCPDTVVCGFQYLIEYDWVSTILWFTDLHDLSRSFR